MHNFCSIRHMKWMYASLLLAFLATSCSKMKEPEFRRIERFRVKQLGLQQTTIGFYVTYFNPNNFGVNVKEAEADVYMDSVYMGKFIQDSAVAVGKNAEFSVPFSGGISLQKALQLDLKNIGERDVLIRADGNVKVGKAGIFINKKIHYEGKHRLDE